jgi:hypothetical protein
MNLRAVQFLAVILTALALVPGGAHLFELPNKIGLVQEHYFIVQNIYRGWSLFGFVLLAAIATHAIHVMLVRSQAQVVRLAMLALLLMLANLAIFFVWTFPANQATANWTSVPQNWQALRAQWEYSHAANAAVTFLALCAVTWAALKTRRPTML